jgi:hypothetical protein
VLLQLKPTGNHWGGKEKIARPINQFKFDEKQ